MFNLKKSDKNSATSGTSNSMGNRNEPLIWKPVFNTDNTSNSNSEVSNDVESKPSNSNNRVSLSPIPSGPPPLTTFSTQPAHVSEPSKAKSSSSHFKAIVDYSSNSNESNASSCPQRGPGTAVATGDKQKQRFLSPGKDEAAQSELPEDAETLVNSIDGGHSSNAAKSENKKKKKKKDKSKDKDKKHKKKDKEKQQADDVEVGGADESSSKKRDKKLKKELKRQKKLQKLAMAGLKPDGDGLESSAAGENKPDLDSDSSNDEEDQARSAADLSVAAVEKTEDQKSNEAKPHLSLKISRGSLVVKSEANVKQGE